MKKILFCFVVNLCFLVAGSQTVSQKIALAYKNFEADSQLKNAISSLYIIEAGSGKVVFDKNSTVGLAPASTQKIITAATAYELLGKNFSYKTTLAYSGRMDGRVLDGILYLTGSGDPTLGSWRWKQTGEEETIQRFLEATRKLGIKEYGAIKVNAYGWQGETVPDGWIWQDIGNYYGAGADVINWRENQYDLLMKSGKDIGSPVMITGTNPPLYHYGFNSEVKAAAKGTGDRSYIYFPLHDSNGNVRGTIPVNEDRFVISGAMPSGVNQLVWTLMDSLDKAGISHIKGKMNDHRLYVPFTGKVIHTEQSPPLDSIVYWFLRKSINLYGEALVRTFAGQHMKTKKESAATTANGIQLLQEFWKVKGIAPTELNMADGSGLSPLNRVTTRAQVQVLAHARKQSWYAGFFHGFPEYNGMKIKSGTINDVKGFCGYHTSKAGKEYIFSFLVNNYNGSSSTLVSKMYRLLDHLK